MRASDKNIRIRKAMLQEYLTQSELAEILGISTGEMSTMLKYELAPEEQRNILEQIKAWASKQEGEQA